MCFVTRSFYEDTDVFVYCFDFGFHVDLGMWLTFVKDYDLEAVNEHSSPTDPTMHYVIYCVPFDNAADALACVKRMYMERK